ncbi:MULTISPECIES: pyruvate ferredoxin oxidoreductase [unclassified Actinobaculum]|uniref:pyruvate ferredoxin oxidoreductase n=1 Tax=unclassified Actinobaculum TaxID=2609299 RepID=UPI000D528077|nr:MULTISPECIES: pyruvate ferredoxin oxidoreductase [unclassified Actinobaculum]AWE42323.1 pyruvate ferredoxin oxidoreductase [Actinobaculum sp. 313]RTE50891.1 pyruvate ferredoxin oxidoreductase [Actinobaculum sp. 352]
MLEQIEGSKAIAHTVARCHPEVVSAYPISPQTHIVEEVSRMVKTGELSGCEYVNVESEFAAMSACIGASAAGARTYTATASQGLLFMVEAVYNASGLGLPIVMTVANRAIGGPINIWNDQSDTMSQRDSGWLQLYAMDNQEAADLHVQAFKLAEELSLPIMVCMDGFILTHAVEQVNLPEEDQIARFLPPFEPRQLLDPSDPISIGAMVGPEAFTEVKYLGHIKQLEALDRIPEIQSEFQQIFGRDSGGLLHSYRTEDAETIVLCLGSITGTIRDVVDARRERGDKIGVVSLVAFRPFPTAAVHDALDGAKRVLVVEKAFSSGIGGIVAAHVRGALEGSDIRIYELIAGLGGRDVTQPSLNDYFDKAEKDAVERLTFLDLQTDIVKRELERQEANRRSGASPENIVRDVTRKMMEGAQ